MSGILGNFKGEPWPYQKEDGDLLVRKGSLLLGHKTGLGKTFISLYGACEFSSERIIIIGTKSSLATWLTEIPEWTEGTPMYLGAKTKNLQDEWKLACQKGRPGIWLLNHSMFQQLVHKNKSYKKPHWDVVINDEAHKARNRTKLLHKALKAIGADHRIEASATFASRGAQDIYAPLNRIDPRMFPSYWKFVNTFCYVEDSPYGKDVFGTRNASKLRELLKDYYVTRKYADVKGQMPSLRRKSVVLEMDSDQDRLYRKLEKDLMLDEGERLIITPGSLARDVRLRQIALAPQILDPSFPRGAGIEYLMEEIPAEDQHAVVFSQFKEVLYKVREALTEQGVKCFMLQGGMEPDEVVEEVRRFKEVGGTMLCTIAFAQSFALDTVGRAYVLGTDPDPTNNIQAEGRLRRGNSVLGAGGVLVKYIVIAGTREEDFKNIVNDKVGTVGDFFPSYTD